MMTAAMPHIDPKAVAGQRVAVLGAARSGQAAAALLRRNGAEVFVSDGGSISEEAKKSFQGEGIDFESGNHSPRSWEADLVVTSPGVPDTSLPIREAQQAGVPVISEIELASWFCRAKTLAITGSNGKTTTAHLLGHILRQAGHEVYVCGNVGLPFSTCADTASDTAMVVLEVSSFQLDHVDTFRPEVAVLLNITPDHLDRYANDIDRYAASKFRISEQQTQADHFIYSMDDERLVRSVREREQTGLPGPRALGITLSDSLTTDIDENRHQTAAGFLRNGNLMLCIDNKEDLLMHSNELALKGRHNVYNSLAAAVAARVVEVRSDVVRESLRSFEGVPHRLESVRDVDGVRYVNDSKATNVNAVWYALESFREPVVLIVGGRDKGNDYSSLVPLIQQRVRAVIAIGEAAPRIHHELGQHVQDAVIADTLADAVQLSQLLARTGDVVLLSPACSSFDMFDSFEDRGDQFRQLVSNL